MEIHRDNLHGQIVTDNPDLLAALRKLYRFKIPGAEYAPSYRKGFWDGMKNFIDSEGAFFVGLLPRVLEDLKIIECEPDIIPPLEEYPLESVEEIVGDFELRTYQKTIVEKAIHQRRGIVKSPTGSGKTLMLASVLNHLQGKKAIILFHQKHIMNQTYDFLKEYGIPDLGRLSGEGFERGNVMLCTVQSLKKIAEEFWDSEILMIDEVHEFSSGDSRLAAIEGFPDATYRLGFTATVPNDPIKLYALEGALGPVIEVVTTKNLIDDGYLAKPVIQIIKQPQPQLSLVENTYSYGELYELCITDCHPRNSKINKIVKAIARDNKSARIMILVKTLKHADILSKMISGSYKLEGKDDLVSRYSTIKKFLKERGTSVLIGTKILQTGIDIKEITHFILAGGSKSESPTLQAIGRSLRKNQEKVHIFDFYDDIKYFRKHSKSRIKIYKSEGHEVIETWTN